MTERDLLTEIAREDTDGRVRRAAIAKLMDPAALATFVADADGSIRDQAVAMLRDIALEAFEGVTETDSLAAVDALTDTRALALVAKSAASEAVAARALERVGDTHVAGSIARHAQHESVRQRAFAVLTDHGEILSVALNCEFREPASSAVERITDRGELEQIAARARSKNASKRARAVVRDIEEREAREREARESEEREQRARAVVDAQPRTQAAAAADEPANAAGAAEEERAAEAAAAAERASQEADVERRRQEDEAAEHEAQRSRARQSELVEEAVRIAAVEDFSAARRQIAVIRREWADVTARTSPAESDAARYAEAERAFSNREAAVREADQKARRDALLRLQQLVARAEPLAPRDDLSLKVGERVLRDVREALGSMPPLPSKADHDDIVQRLKAVQTALTPRVQELREVAGWQRWANIGIQEQLVEKMEALKAVEDPEFIARQVKNLQQQWRQAADVPRAQGELLWRRFKAAHDDVWAKCEAYFASQAAEREANLEKKLALSEKAEQLANSTNWIQTADAIKALQAEWKSIGPVSRGQEKAVWERFRSACDRFFTRRHADLAERKTVWAANLSRKEALVAKVEGLVESSDWEPTASEIKRIQAEWKTIGPVKKSRSEALWQRFRGACDRFFERYAQRHDIARAERVAAREAIVAELESLASDETVAEPPVDFLTKVRTLRVRWQQELAARGVDRERAAALDERYAAAFAKVLARWPSALAGSEFDPESNRRRMESIVKRIEELANSIAGPPDAADASLSPTTRLATMLRDALAANTIGGKPADNESRYRAADEEVRQAQANWSRIGPVPDEVRRAFVDRFQAAIRRIHNQTGSIRNDARRDARPDSRGMRSDRPKGPRPEPRRDGAPEARRDRQEVGSK